MSAWDQRFTEPGALSSTAPIDFPPSALRLPRTASGDDFDLLASRARCKNEPIGRGRGDARSPRTEDAQFANIAPRPLRRPPGERRNGTIGSPSRVRFRPPPPSTFRPQPCGFRVLPPVTTSTYSRPLLGANTTLDRDDPGCKGCRTGNRRNLRNFSFFSSNTAIRARCYESGELVSGPPADARHGTKGSPSRVRFRPPPPLTFRPQPCGFRVRPPVTTSTYSRPVLGARRTLRIGQGRRKGGRKGKRPQIAPRFPHSAKTPGDKPVDWARGASRMPT